jgi:hypothetical protein
MIKMAWISLATAILIIHFCADEFISVWPAICLISASL